MFFTLQGGCKRVRVSCNQHKDHKLRETLTLSGVAIKILHRSNKGEGILLFYIKNYGLYQRVQRVQSKIVGGPSNVSCRYVMVNETVIDDANVESIVG